MISSLKFPEQESYTVTVENVTVGLLIENEVEMDLHMADLTSLTQHDHAYIELFACLSGRIAISTEKGELYLFAGDVGIIPADLRHVKKTHEDSCQYVVIGMVFLRRYIRNCSNLYRTLTGLCGGKDIRILRNRPAFCESIAALTETPFSDRCLPALRLTLLLAETADRMNEAKDQNGNKEYISDTGLDLLSRLDYLINSCFMNDMTASYAANLLFISERQLARIAKKRYGITFRQAVQSKRLNVAAKMLVETGSPVAKIAQAVGFGSVCSFFRAFSKHYGMTPTEYRYTANGIKV